MILYALMKVRNLVSTIAIVALASSQVAFAASAVAGDLPIARPITSSTPAPIVKPISSPITSPITIPTPPAPTMVYPQNRQILDLEGAYMFKVNPVPGASGYLFGFFQDGKMVFENYRDLHTLSSTEFAIWENMPAHNKFHAGNVDVYIRALVNGRWTDARVITITLRPRPVVTPTTRPSAVIKQPAVVKNIASKPTPTIAKITPVKLPAVINKKPTPVLKPVVINRFTLPLKGILQTIRFW